MNRHRTRFCVAAALGLTCFAAQAQSKDSAVAQALFDQAKQLLAHGHASEACPKLEESERLEPRSGTLINLASCYEKTSRLASAWSTYIEAATSAKAAGNNAREAVARESAAKLAPFLGNLAIMVTPALKSLADLEIRRDGVVVREPEWDSPLPADAGEHVVTAKAAGYLSFETRVTVVDGSNARVTVPELVAAPGAPVAATTQPVPAQPSLPASPGLGKQRMTALIAGGVGLVALGVGGAFALASKSKHDDAAKFCSGNACSDPRGVSDGNSAQTDGNLSTAAVILGGVGLAAGITLWFTTPKTAGRDEPTAQLGLGFGDVRLQARF